MNTPRIRSEFAAHALNLEGHARNNRVGEILSETLQALEELCGSDSREMALVRTKLQEVCFFARRGIAARSENQAAYVPAQPDLPAQALAPPFLVDPLLRTTTQTEVDLSQGTEAAPNNVSKAAG